jgi:hypothetical protein
MDENQANRPNASEQAYSRKVQADHYFAMTELLKGLVAFPPDEIFVHKFQEKANDILASMKRHGVPKGPAVRATDRAAELHLLELAYRLASGVYPGESPHLQQARTLIVEALKAWERAHPPEALDPLLL